MSRELVQHDAHKFWTLLPSGYLSLNELVLLKTAVAALLDARWFTKMQSWLFLRAQWSWSRCTAGCKESCAGMSFAHGELRGKWDFAGQQWLSNFTSDENICAFGSFSNWEGVKRLESLGSDELEGSLLLRLSLGIPGWPRTYCVAQAGLRLNGSPVASASECWDRRCKLPHPSSIFTWSSATSRLLVFSTPHFAVRIHATSQWVIRRHRGALTTRVSPKRKHFSSLSCLCISVKWIRLQTFKCLLK